MSTDPRLIMMVAHLPFETSYDQFCRLVPVVYTDGTPAPPSDYPNEGEIWWMLTAKTAHLAEPGRLVVGTIEDAVKYSKTDPGSSLYQVRMNSVQELDRKDGMEIIDVPGDALDDIQGVAADGFRLPLPVRPSPTLLLRWRAHLYGPFTCMADASGKGNPMYRFSPASTTDLTVYRIDEPAFRQIVQHDFIESVDKVSTTTRRRSERLGLMEVQHRLVLDAGYQRVLATHPKKIVLEPIERKLVRFAKKYVSKGRRQQLKELLQEVESAGRQSDDAQEFIEEIARFQQGTEIHGEALDAVATALLKSGILGEDRIQKAEQTFAEKYVQGRTAELQATIETNLKSKQNEVRRVENHLKELQGKLQNDEVQARAKLERELALERERARKGMAEERKAFDRQKAELERQQGVLKENLEKVTGELREAGDSVVNKFLTIAPLLGTLRFAERNGTREEHSEQQRPASPSPSAEAPATFRVPAYLSAAWTAAEKNLAEETFMDRFRRVVEESGFLYRLLDLQRFHLSVKCGPLTVLGGPSGTGKSSLPALYSRALLGEEAAKGRGGCLMVNVNPSWLDFRDLIGHLNTLDGRFYPAESGVFHQLVYAQEEWKARSGSSGLYLICLDEMNLSQVEYYFSDFMMVLERRGPDRAVQCFAPETAKPSCPWHAYDRVQLSPALRFVGTVNFDETTRLLSDRFLDRVNLLYLHAHSLPAIAGASSGGMASAAGRMVTLSDFERWQTSNALPTELGSLLDQIRQLLDEMGCLLSPRVYRAICHFISSATPLLTAAKAFDVQIAQRIVPKVRSLVTRRQVDALDQLLRLLNSSNACAFDETLPLLEQARQSAVGRGWDLED